MHPTIDRIQKLLRLATNNPNDAEARSAALAAAKLIMEHKCVLTLPVVLGNPHASPIDDTLRKYREDAQRQAREVDYEWEGRFYKAWKNL